MEKLKPKPVKKIVKLKVVPIQRGHNVLEGKRTISVILKLFSEAAGSKCHSENRRGFKI